MRLHLWAAVVAAALGIQAYGGVLVVDAAGGVGVFTTVQSAVNSASNGDIVLVKPGFYAVAGQIVIDGKSIVLVGDAGPTRPWITSLRLRNIPSTGSVVVRGLEINATPFGANQAGVIVEFCAGGVLVEDCALRGCGGTQGGLIVPSTDGTPAIALAGATRVVFSRCVVDGGAGVDSGGFGLASYGASGGGPAARIDSGANVAWFDCVLTGGKGGKQSNSASLGTANRGGDGVFVLASTARLSGGSITGGVGGATTGAGFHPGASCGGNGLVLDATSTATLLDVPIMGGAAGVFTAFGPTPQPGSGIVGPNRAVTFIADDARHFALSSPTHELQPVAATIVGKQGDTVFLFESVAGITNLEIFGTIGWLALQPPLIGPFALGTIAAPNGDASFTVPAPLVPAPAIDGVTFLFQPYFVSSSAAVAGPPSAFVLLHP